MIDDVRERERDKLSVSYKNNKDIQWLSVMHFFGSTQFTFGVHIYMYFMM